MHELGISRRLVRMILDEKEERNLEQVSLVVVALGERCSYKKEPIELYYGLLKMEEPSLKESQIEIIQIPYKAACMDCGSDVTEEFCQSCGSLRLEIMDGAEFILKEIRGR